MSTRRRSHRRPSAGPRTLAFFTCLLALPGCATLGLGGLTIISVEEEWEMGRQFEVELAQELPLSDDPVVNEYVTEIGQLLVSQTELADREWRFHVVEEPHVNAFNVPGGLVYVYTGLLDEVGNAAEFVALMGHEVGHGVARHGAERLTQQYGLSVLAQVVLGQDPGLVQQIVAEIVAAGTMARFSRSQEFEADEIGVQLMAEGGYDPEGMVALLERLLALREREPGSVERFFATHPAVEDRIDRAEDEIDALGALADLRTDDERFRRVQARVR